ncbi:hypothetical protein GH714_042329 [Hevea brasiliensis]|uniref:Protein kinase domain-containing protein n=1 Tax=Hevea brasiliensis TaxID=3981 RepID=A0A6A6K927_HEVBR|nr:hypothetical protein GH714_042329 [Hevea brasiliensis]
MEMQNDEKKRDFILDDPSPRGVLEIPILSPDSDHSGSSSSSNSTEKLVPEREATREGKHSTTNQSAEWPREHDWERGPCKSVQGVFIDGQVVAVKKLVKTEKEQEDRIGDFLSELGIIAHINHPNAAKLLGFSIDGGLHLVLEFLPHGSLASVLHGGGDCLEWKKRFKVAVGIAEGLKYLHHDCQRRIIHRDIKASNICLVKIMKLRYLAPEYFMHGIVNEKTDVFAYGVLLLEIITGRHAVDSSRQSLAMWAKPLLQENNAKDVVDPRLGDDYDPIEMKHAMLTASECINHLPSMRPHMNRVVQLLRGEETPMELKQKTNAGRAVILDGCDIQDYTCTTYLNDLNRHMQLVME